MSMIEMTNHARADAFVDDTSVYGYHKNGNTLTRDIGGGTIHNYSYDYANRLKSYVKTANSVPTSSFTYSYAPSGERVLKTNQLAGSTTAFVYDGADVVTDYSVPVAGTYTSIKSYVQGLGIDSKFAEIDSFGATLFYDNDALGTVHQVVDTPPLNQDAQVVNRQLTTAWGEDLLQPSQVTRYGFTLRERDDESDLMYYRARHYSPRLGRFGQKDPVNNLAPVTHYSYSSNNPITHSDPFGLDDPKAVEEETKRTLRQNANSLGFEFYTYPSQRIVQTLDEHGVELSMLTEAELAQMRPLRTLDEYYEQRLKELEGTGQTVALRTELYLEPTVDDMRLIIRAVDNIKQRIAREPNPFLKSPNDPRRVKLLPQALNKYFDPAREGGVVRIAVDFPNAANEARAKRLLKQDILGHTQGAYPPPGEAPAGVRNIQLIKRTLPRTMEAYRGTILHEAFHELGFAHEWTVEKAEYGKETLPPIDDLVGRFERTVRVEEKSRRGRVIPTR